MSPLYAQSLRFIKAADARIATIEREKADLTDRLNRIAELCRKHSNPSVNIGAHALAEKILKIVEGEA